MKDLKIIVLLCTAILLSDVSLGQDNEKTVWVENSFADFRDGSFEDGGRDLYVTSEGVIKTVRRFDFNSDGFIDFPVNSSHDVDYHPPVSLFEFSDTDQNGGQHKELPVQGSLDAQTADLNNDGFLDVVFIPSRNGTTPRRYLTIFWGGNGGWVNHRRTNLATMGAKCLEIADLNGDSWPEIIVLNASRWSPLDGPEAVVRIYWGSPDTYMHHDATDMVINRAVDLKTADVNGDNRIDMILLLAEPGEIEIYSNNGFDRDMNPAEIAKTVIDVKTQSVNQLIVSQGENARYPDYFVFGGDRVVLRGNPTTGTARYSFSNVFYMQAMPETGKWKSPRKIVVPPASKFAIYDIDKDRHRDLIVMNSEQDEASLTVLWGNSGDEFVGDESTTIDVEYISAVAFGDMNSDGITDIAAGIGRADSTFQGESYVIYGKGERKFEVSDIRVPTSSVGHVLFVPEQDLLVFCNGRKARIYEDVPVSVYWGDEDGFDPARITSYKMQAAYSSAGADLNDDGYPDMIQLSIVHAFKEDHPLLGFNIFWGNETGLNAKSTNVHEFGAWGLEVVDFDGDGYLDLLSAINKANFDGSEPEGLVIWHGGKDGFQRTNREMIAFEGQNVGNLTADYNKDGYMDVVVIKEAGNKVMILWGSDQGLSLSNSSEFSFPGPADLETADLNQDGWLDLLVTSHSLAPSIYWDYGTYIYWGSADGFNPANAQRLPGQDGLGITVADWDADGYLDILLPNYHMASSRESVPARLFWGSEAGYFDDVRTDIMQDGGDDAIASDFNHDGMLDILIANHTGDGNHNRESKLYINDGKRFRNPEIQFLPALGPHYIYRSDIGNLYDRSYRHKYSSSLFELDGAAENGRLQYSAKIPEKCQIEFFIRGAGNREALAEKEWIQVDAADGFFDLQPEDRVVQYSAVFHSDNGDRYPELGRVSIEFN